jgi:predicted metalloprotease with PDZ domain
MEYSFHEVRPLLVRALFSPRGLRLLATLHRSASPSRRRFAALLSIAFVALLAGSASAQDALAPPEPPELGSAGLGMVIAHRDGHLTIVEVLPSMPAERAGLRAGDRIVRIEQTATRPLLLYQAGGALRGEPGTEVTVWISRERKRGRWSRPRAYRVVRELLPQLAP